MQILYAFGILLSVSSGPEVVAQTAAAPSAALSGNTTVIGVHNSTTGLDTFLGIRYAHPPLGNLRFALPSLLLSSEGVINASAYGPVCMQVPSVCLWPCQARLVDSLLMLFRYCDRRHTHFQACPRTVSSSTSFAPLL